MDDIERNNRIAGVLSCLEDLTASEALSVLRESAQRRADILDRGPYQRAWLLARDRLESVRSFAWTSEQYDARKKREDASTP